VEVLEDRLPLGDALLGLLLAPVSILPDGAGLHGVVLNDDLGAPPARDLSPPAGGKDLPTFGAFPASPLPEGDLASPAFGQGPDGGTSEAFARNPRQGDVTGDPLPGLATFAAGFVAQQPARRSPAEQTDPAAGLPGASASGDGGSLPSGTVPGHGGTTIPNGPMTGGLRSTPLPDGAFQAARMLRARAPADAGRVTPPDDRPSAPSPASTLPAPWMSGDIGDVGLAGSATQANNVYTLQGSGDDIFGSRDAFHFVYQPLQGDGEILARVTGVQNTDAWAKAGVMIRQSLSPDSAHAMMVLTPAQGSSFQYRTTTAGDTTFTNPVDPSFPWMRVVRSGNTFTGYRSGNGHDWVQSGSIMIPMTGTAYVGLVVTSHNNSQLNTSTFDHVTANVRSPFAWGGAAPLPVARFEADSAAVNGRMYVFGGFYNAAIQATTEADRYDPATDTWSLLSDMPQPITHAGTAVDGQTVYLAGGFVGDGLSAVTDRVLTYDVSTDTWGDAPPLPEARGAGALVRLGRQLHYFGGLDATFQDRGDHWVLNLDGGTAWVSAAPMPNPRNHLGYTDLGGLAYAIGGQHALDEGAGNQAEVDAYDPSTDTWTAVAPLPIPRGHVHTSTFVLGSRIVIVGGETNGGRDLADVTEYDPTADNWVALTPLPETRQAASAQQIAGQIIVAGGRVGGGPTATTRAGVLPNSWETDAPLPVALGEVAGGLIGNTLYLVGEGSPATLAYDLPTGTWRSAGLATRPFVGNHHAAEVYNGKLYLLGGLSGGSEGKVQIYDPVLNTWTLGADMPFAAGSSSSAVINGAIYVAGGIVGSDTTNQVAVYDPTGDAWTMRSPMPQGRNHAASATDGTFLYVFGGRVGPNAVANGFDTVEIYDPIGDTWHSSDLDPSIAPLPQNRGGMGKAVYYNGEFYVMGGETLNGSAATPQDVYNRVDVYDPLANVWRQAPVLPTARHGIFPLLAAGRIYVAGGGVHSGNSQSTTLEVYNPS
jgi:N-acetylneuraminic acid mutarotase